MKSKKGITLIALVITIIVLLILAGVSISMIIKNNGIVSNSTQAREKTRAAYIQEQIEITVTESKLGSYSNDNTEIKSKEELVQKFLEEGILSQNEVNILEESDTIEIAGVTVDFSSLSKENVKIVGEGFYNTLAECVTDVVEGDKIIIAKNISNESVLIDKSIEITSENAMLLNNVAITANGQNVELTVSNLNFTGTSYINANNAKSLIVENVHADVTLNSADSVTNSRAAFISLGASELNNVPLFVKISNNNIVVTGNNNPDPVLGWRYIADGSIINDNTFGAEGKAVCEAVKLMNFMDDAVVTVRKNIAYVWGNGFSFGQNNSRANEYTAIVEENTFMGTADYIWVEATNGSGVILANIIANNNKVGNADLQVTDIKTNNRTIALGVIQLQKDAQGKIIGGTYSSLIDSSYIENIRANLAEGYTLTSNEDGTYSVEVND